jgi:AIG2-like family
MDTARVASSPRTPLSGVGDDGGGNAGTHCVAATLSRVPLYAAYGSNMDPAQMMQRAPHSPMAMTGWLIGWRLTFGGEDLNWEGALATVVEDPTSQVFVVIYDVTPEDEKLLDRWEGEDFGLHKKLRLRVHTLDGSELAWLYVLDAYEGGLPSARYLGVIADAAEAAGAPEDYVAELRSRPCAGIGP